MGRMSDIVFAVAGCFLILMSISVIACVTKAFFFMGDRACVMEPAQAFRIDENGQH